MSVIWSLEGGPARQTLSFTWKESGGPEVTPPERKGFGSRLIESVSKTFADESSLHFNPEGLCWKVTARANALSAF